MLYYDWQLQSQRINHSPGAYECLRFYNTTQSCSILWNSNQMFALTLNVNGSWNCCMGMNHC